MLGLEGIVGHDKRDNYTDAQIGKTPKNNDYTQFLRKKDSLKGVTLGLVSQFDVRVLDGLTLYSHGHLSGTLLTLTSMALKVFCKLSKILKKPAQQLS